MNCEMERWNSDLQVEYFETKEEAADFIASEEARKENYTIDRIYTVIEGNSMTDKYLLSAKETLDILLEGSTI